MASTTPRGITYPTSGDNIAPLETHFATLANDVDSAITDAITGISVSEATGTLPIASGGTGATTAATAISNLNALTADSTVAGKNKIINGAFDFWQRTSTGTFSNPADSSYSADRWRTTYNGTGATHSISRQAFSAGEPAGNESAYYLRCQVTVAGTGNTYRTINQAIEDVRTLAGKIVTISFWARSDSVRSLPQVTLRQMFGSGGSTFVDETSSQWYKDGVIQPAGASVALSTSFARYSTTITLPSLSGKTIGANSSLDLIIFLPTNTTMTVDIFGVQVEAGPNATAFSRAGGTIQGELAACQRYYVRMTAPYSGAIFGTGLMDSNLLGRISIPLPVTMRTHPTAVETSGTASDYTLRTAGNTITTASAVPAYFTSTDKMAVVDVAIGSAAGAQGQGVMLRSANSTAYLGYSAEL